MEGVRATPLANQEEFAAEGQQWIGQSYTLPFTCPLEMGPRFAVRGCKARFGVSPFFLRAVTNLKTGDDFVDGFLKDTDLRLDLHADEDEGTADDNLEFPENRQAERTSHYALNWEWARVHLGLGIVAPVDDTVAGRLIAGWLAHIQASGGCP